MLKQNYPTVHCLKKDFLEIPNNFRPSDGNNRYFFSTYNFNNFIFRHILNSKAVKDGQMLDLSIRNSLGKTVLHYLVEHKDEENFRILLDREELTVQVANIPDKEGKTPMIYCLTKGNAGFLLNFMKSYLHLEKLFLWLFFQFLSYFNSIIIFLDQKNLTKN